MAKKPFRGDPLKIEAHQWSDMLRIDEKLRSIARGREGPVNEPAARDATWVWVRNDSGAACDWHGVLGLDGLLITPDDNLADFLKRPLYSGALPEFPGHDGKFAIMLDAVPDGGIGRGAIIGSVRTKVKIESGDEWMRYADVDDGEAGRLLALPAGTAEILGSGSPDDDSVCWCDVRLANYCGSPLEDAVLNADLAGGGSAEADLYIDGSSVGAYTVYAPDYFTSGTIASGSHITVQWRRGRRRWEGAGAPCDVAES